MECNKQNWMNRLAVRRLIVFAWHVMGIILAYLGAFCLRLDFHLDGYWSVILRNLPLTVVAYLGTFLAFRLYRGIWTYFSFQECLRVFPALFIGAALHVGIISVANTLSQSVFPRSIFALTLLLLLSWEFGGRFVIRWFRQHSNQRELTPDLEQRCLIIGPSEGAAQVLRGARIAMAEVGKIVGILNDESENRGLTIDRVRIIGSTQEIGILADGLDITKVLILPPYDSPKRMRAMVDACFAAGATCSFQVIPSIKDLASGRVNISSMRDVEIEDLLDREPASFDRRILDAFIRGRKVMVTGAGGSIGSELARQVATHGPSHLVLFEANEFSLFNIDRELHRNHPDLPMTSYTGDIRRAHDVRDAIQQAGGIDIIYHAAAYKHVHLMEKNVPSCFDNNVLGSKALAEVATAEGVKNFILISSDKAVRPTSIMGATKRLAERAVLEGSAESMKCVAVRFGNVLGSSGSVIPLFRKQIQEGGPVTVTTPETRRYFMTIPEAVELVLMAGAVGEDEQIMVLEMGEPVKIIDLARRLIRLSGYVPDEDIQIKMIGLRPGEKEYEELLTSDENVVRTAYDKIWVLAKTDGTVRKGVDLAKLTDLVENKEAEPLILYAMREIPEHKLSQLGERLPLPQDLG